MKGLNFYVQKMPHTLDHIRGQMSKYVDICKKNQNFLGVVYKGPNSHKQLKNLMFAHQNLLGSQEDI